MNSARKQMFAAAPFGESMSFQNPIAPTLSLFAMCLIAPWLTCCAAPSADNPVADSLNLEATRSFSEAVSGLRLYRDYRFGTDTQGSQAIRTIADLQKYFEPYGIAGHTVINREWQRYQPFNEQNFVFTTSALNLTAQLAPGVGVRPGGITSGQIWSRDVFQPGREGQSVLAISIRMKIPSGRGGWPAAWLYTKDPGKNDASEIDNPEFFNETNQNQFDWTGYQHGPGVGHQIFSIMTNKWVWHPGVDFSASFHDYQTLWTEDSVYKYVDGKLIFAQAFRWTAKGPAQLGIDLAVGTDDQGAFPGLQPTTADEFPMVLSIQSIEIWAR